MRRPRTATPIKLITHLAAALLLTRGSAAAAFGVGGATAARARPATPARQARPGVVAIRAARSLPAGSAVTVEGVVTTPPGAFRSSTEDEGFAVEDASGAGLYVRTNDKIGLRVGRRARVTGRLDESNGKLVLVPAGVRGIERLGRRVAPPRPQRFSTREIGEATEGRLVSVAGRITKPVQPDAPYGFRFFVDDGTGEVQIFVSASTKIPRAGLRPGRRVRVTGFSGQYKEHYEVEPRFASDISFPHQSLNQRRRRAAGEASRGDAPSRPGSEGEAVRLSAEGTKARAVRRVAPRLQHPCRCQGTVMVRVLVDAEGRVASVSALSGHPLLRASAVVAAKQWAFNAPTKDGRPAAFTGLLAFTFKSHGEVTF